MRKTLFLSDVDKEELPLWPTEPKKKEILCTQICPKIDGEMELDDFNPPV